MKHFISLLDYSSNELSGILDRADELAEAWKAGDMPDTLRKRQIGLWFYGNGFRNRLAFEIGAKAMGASVSCIPGELGLQEPLEDMGHYLGNWYDLLIVRAKNHRDLLRLAGDAGIPVINARTDFSHPCEIMGDLQFIRRYRGSLEGLNVVFAGEVTNLCMSWFEAAARFPVHVIQIAPEEYLAGSDTLSRLNSGAAGRIDTACDLEPAIRRADLVYTDCWPKSADPEMAGRIRERFLPYQITERHLSELGKGAIFLPCPPVTRGEEVSEDAMNSELCLNYRAKEYLLHTQNAIMEMLLG